MKRISVILFFAILLIISNFCTSKKTGQTISGPPTTVVHPEWIKKSVMYEVNIRQYTPEGTFNAFTGRLSNLKKLGVDILWLMPVNPIGEINRKGPLGSYYSVKDYKATNPEFGTMDDFKKLVRKVHELGMFLIIDWVPNHSAWDNPLVKEHPEWYAKDSLGNMYSPWDWTDVVKFDYGRRALRDYQIDAMKYWLTETGLDGFRFDVAHQVPVDFWNEVRPALQSVKPDVLLLAEAEQRFLHQNAMDVTYAWELHHLMNSVAQGKATVRAIDEYFTRAAKDYNSNDIRMCFTSNHDENSWNGTEWERMGQATEVMTIFTYTIPGMPLIYSGQEAGSSKRLKFFERDPIEWNSHPFFALYKDLNRMKKDNPALWNPGFGGTFERLNTGRDEQVFAFIRALDRNRVITVLNLSPARVTVKLDPAKAGGTYRDHFTGKRVKPASSNIDLDSWGYKIFVK